MRNRLFCRLAIPVVGGVLLLWGGLLAVALNLISEVVADHADHQLRSYARETRNILTESNEFEMASMRALAQKLAQNSTQNPAQAQAQAAAAERGARRQALDRLLRLYRIEDVPAVVLDANGSELLRHAPGGLRVPVELTEQMTTMPMKMDGLTGHAIELAFQPWGWRVVLGDVSTGYQFMAADIRNISLGGAAFLLVGLLAYLHYTRRTVSEPLESIRDALQRGERPGYKGIEEFSAVAESIGKVMDSLEERDRQLRVSRTWYRQMFEAAPVMMFSVTQDGRLSDVNRMLCEHGGYSRENLVGMEAERLVLMEPGQLRGLWSGLSMRKVPVLLRLKGGEQRRALLNALLTEDPVGRQVVLAAVMDVTDQQNTERDLREARDAAEAANRAKGEFLANVSHEIRTPLNGMLGMLQLLERSQLEPRQMDWVGNALECGRSLYILLGDILDFSSLESDGAGFAEEPFSPAGLLFEMAQLFSHQAQDKDILLAVVPEAGLPGTMIGAGGRLRQALFNLVGNAVKFTQSGSVTLKVGMAGETSDGAALLRFEVSDTGIGIGPDKLRSVFEPFTQADGSHTRRYQGAGLGLAIVSRLVSLWGGRLDMASAPGRGTTVSVTIPARPAPPGIEAPHHAPATLAAPRGAGRVLLAEDDPINTVLTMDMLESLGYRATIVENGSQAIKALSQEDFDCLLMDLQMPEMDGITATRVIRSDSDLGLKAEIPIIALAGHALPGDRERVLAAGMNDYLAKPVDFEHLEMVLARVMGNPARRRLS
ncbi:hybrid sensor histidine kinase/response regulator [Fundidesulfovibrio soli]|uniref:hybrid sensor histidine kinase/response regulator n=1 Tax=Fundidesulfovibrio soli TaxID=2922716 RepID=UPI001FAF422D|nr:ATP-binding protein [Fundidesulfovibrio soli]